MTAVVSKAPIRGMRTVGTRTCFVIGLLLLVATPAVGLWLPWAGDKDKIEKTANDVWRALVNKDLKTLRLHVAGSGATLFIKQEIQIINSLKIEGYECHVKKLQLEPLYGNIAFVELEKIGTQEDGEQITRRNLSIFRKAGGEWKLLVEEPKDRRSKRTFEEFQELEENEAAEQTGPKLPQSKVKPSEDASGPNGPTMDIPSTK